MAPAPCAALVRKLSLPVVIRNACSCNYCREERERLKSDVSLMAENEPRVFSLKLVLSDDSGSELEVVECIAHVMRTPSSFRNRVFEASMVKPAIGGDGCTGRGVSVFAACVNMLKGNLLSGCGWMDEQWRKERSR